MNTIPEREHQRLSRRIFCALLALVIGGSGILIACNKKKETPKPVLESTAPPAPVEAPKENVSPGFDTPPPNTGVKIEDEEERIGPFNLNGKNLTVILKYKKSTRNGFENDKTVGGFEVRDENNTLYRKETFGTPKLSGESDSFETSIKMTVFRIEGESGEGLIVYYDIAPNIPPAGKAFQLFGLNGEKLEPLSAVISVNGSIEPSPSGGSFNSLRLLQGDLIQIHQVVDNVTLRIPFRVDFRKSNVQLAQSSGLFDIEISGQQSPERGEIPFFLDFRPGAEKEMVVLKGTEPIKIISAYAEVRMNEAATWNKPLEISNLWLKITIGEKEGWVTGKESYARIGLQGIRSP